MPPVDTPLTRERILAAAEDVVRRFGPAKATVSDVARALGVSHAAVYRHVPTKADLRDLVVGRWVEEKMAPLRAIATARGPAPARLRTFFDELIAAKRHRSTSDPELFSAYRELAAASRSVTNSHVDELIELLASIVRSGMAELTIRDGDPTAIARAVLNATYRFHHPVHAGEWSAPGIDREFDDVWSVLMDGLLVKQPARRR